MATAQDLRREFTRFMDDEGVRYAVLDEDDNILYLAFDGDKDTFVLVDFDEEGDDATSVHFVSQGFAKAEKPKIPAALVKLNEINRQFRWVKFHMADDGAISADADAALVPGHVGEACWEIVLRMSGIIENALDELDGIAETDRGVKRALDAVAMMEHLP